MDNTLLLGAVLVVVLLLWFLKSGQKKGVFLNRTRQKVKLIQREELSPDTLRLRFALDSKNTVLGLPVGKHFKVYAPNVTGQVAGEWNGRPDAEAEQKEISRSYTPTSSDDDLGFVELVIKVYKGGVIDRFPDGGKMSTYMGNLKIGDSITIQGPYGRVEYQGQGVLKYSQRILNKKHIGMMAGGTGITPMLQIITAILKDPKDTTQLSIIFANQTEPDILLRDMLEGIASEHPGRLQLWYTLDRPPADWAFSEGFITEQMIAEHLPSPGDDTVILMCGPPPMIKYACKANLDKLGYDKADQISF